MPDGGNVTIGCVHERLSLLEARVLMLARRVEALSPRAPTPDLLGAPSPTKVSLAEALAALGRAIADEEAARALSI